MYIASKQEENRTGIIGYTAGVFDLFHIGHLNLLTEARKHCDKLIVGITTDELSMSYKGKRPIIPYAERAAIIGAIRFVDEVIPQHAMDRYSVWENRGFDITFVGDDWKGSAHWKKYEKIFSKVGVGVIYMPYTRHISSTLLRSKLQKPS